MPTVETSLGHFEAVCKELGLTVEPSYVFKLGCGCSVYNKDDVLGHLWETCENQTKDFWCDRYMDHGRTVKHHIRVDEIDTIWAGVDIERADVEKLKEVNKELDGKLEFKCAYEYVKILEKYHPTTVATMTVLEEKTMHSLITEWFLREDVRPPQLEEIHLLALAKTALNSILCEFENADTERLTLFGFGDSFST